jgi:hypothetical protein
MSAVLDGPQRAAVSHGEGHCLRAMAMLKLALRRTLREHCCASSGWAYREQIVVWAGVAQLVEHLICNQRVGGSSPFASSSSSQQEKKDGFGCTARPFWPADLRSFLQGWCTARFEIWIDRGLDRAEMGAARSNSQAECAQVAEWLMAADCKSAALCATEVRILPCAPLVLK